MYAIYKENSHMTNIFLSKLIIFYFSKYVASSKKINK